jgi:hypothetical protein
MTIDDALVNLVNRVKTLESKVDKLTKENSSITVPAFSEATWEEISTLLTLHYNNEIDLTNYWKAGDIKENVSLTAISNEYSVGETQSAQDIDLIIIGTNHDTITDSDTKAAFTIAQKDCLSTTGYVSTSYSNYTYAQYSISPRRSWLNDTYLNALPSELQELIKTVDKTTSEPQSTSLFSLISTTEKCFLPSCYEMFGEGSATTDGTQYEYYKYSDTRKKYLGKGSTTYQYWWTRTGTISSNVEPYFFFVNTDGSKNSARAGSAKAGICPCFCI